MFKSGRGISDYLKENRKKLLLILALCAFFVLLCLFPQDVGEIESGGGATDEQTRLSELVSRVDGVGECEVMISYDKDGCPVGIIVLCDGAESPSVKARLCELISSLYGVGANRISILKIAR